MTPAIYNISMGVGASLIGIGVGLVTVPAALVTLGALVIGLTVFGALISGRR